MIFGKWFCAWIRKRGGKHQYRSGNCIRCGKLKRKLQQKVAP